MKATLAAALLTLASATAAQMFVTDRGASTLRTANLDGSKVQALIPSAGTNIRGIAIDTERDELFYADNGADVIYRSRLDGSGRVTVVGSGLGFPADVAIDTGSQRIYWCDRNNNRIERANYDGSSRETVLNSTQPYFLDLDLSHQKIYWGDFSGGNIFRADIADGGQVETLVDTNIQTRGVKVDPLNGYFYWCDRNSHKVQRRKIEGGPIEDLYTGLDTPHGLTLDIPAGKVYWVDTGTNNVIGSKGAKAISRGDMDGSGPHEVLADVTQPWDITLDTQVTSFTEWTHRRFPKDSPVASPDADPDRDGHPNIVEYFADLDPFAPQGISPVEPLLVEGEFHLIYRMTVQPVTDITGIPEFSSDLITWRSGPTVSQEIAVGTGEGPVLLFVERPWPSVITNGNIQGRLRLELDAQ